MSFLFVLLTVTSLHPNRVVFDVAELRCASEFCENSSLYRLGSGVSLSLCVSGWGYCVY
jgi:hypothetical protein